MRCPPMKKKSKLVNKIKHIIKKAGLPRWLHHYGPKKYEFWQHAIALLVKQEGKLSYRRVSKLLSWLGYIVPTYSALAKMSKRLPIVIWQRLLKATVSNKIYISAIDSSGMSRPLPSPYYYKRIDKPYPIEIPLKLSIAVDTRTKKILSLRLRSKGAHDIKDAKYLIKCFPTKPSKLVADKAYDANWLHELCHKKGIQTHIPWRVYGKLKGFSYRTKSAKQFNLRTYHRREIVESVFVSIKKKFGPSINSIRASSRRAEIYSRAIIHNIFLLLLDIFNKPGFYSLE